MIKFIFRWGFRLLILLVVLAGVLVLCKDALIKSLIESRIRTQTGMDVKIARLEIGLFTPTVSIEGFKLFNTPQFGGVPLIDVPDLYLEYDRSAASRRELHFKLVRVNLAEINIVEDAAGKTILPWLQAQQTNPSTNASQDIQFSGIDVLNLSVGTLKLTNLGNPAKSRAIKIGLQNEVLKNVKSANDLSSLAIKLLWQNAREVPDGILNAPNPATLSAPATAPSKTLPTSPRK
jgi:hypothetical protein